MTPFGSTFHYKGRKAGETHISLLSDLTENDTGRYPSPG
jgi:hypothetical protein